MQSPQDFYNGLNRVAHSVSTTKSVSDSSAAMLNAMIMAAKGSSNDASFLSALRVSLSNAKPVWYSASNL